MSRTYAAYYEQPDGRISRLGTFRGPAGSVRNVTAALVKRHPKLDVGRLRIAPRILIMGKYVDGERIQAEL
jgi:hypothetical protein